MYEAKNVISDLVFTFYFYDWTSLKYPAMLMLHNWVIK